ncbi:MAG: IPT/TIG domain-containing protein [Myxococcales bacterium]|nr:IPT/TIG domain-containing protein [Myxococcales bacterium]
MRWVGLLSLAGLALHACIATAPEGVRPHADYGGSAGFDPGAGGTTTGTTTTVPPSDPHAVTGATPPHGPFTGGQHVLVSGNGFTPSARVWFGPNEAAGVVAISPVKLQVDAPPGAAGPVDLATQNGDDASTRRTLVSGYTYDALYAEPSSGPTAGGTVVSIFGASAVWDATSLVRVDQKPCTVQSFVSPTEIECTVPQGTPGAKALSVETAGEIETALDGYTYEDSSDGYKGGLSGAPLAGTLRVLVFDNFTGDALPASHVIVGSDVGSGLYAQTDDTGVVVLTDPSLNAPVTVTVAARCHSPVTFVDVPVDTVTTYLTPVLSPACASSGDPPPVGGKPSDAGAVSGEIVWPGSQEFQKGEWTNVPVPLGPDEQRIAYVMVASGDPEQLFSLPSSTNAVHPDSPGDLGYGFGITVYPGNHAVYALAGILRTTPAATTFTAYAMGAVRGVNVHPNDTAGSVYIPMTATLDQALTLAVEPPPITPKGPDRLRSSIAVEVALRQYAILPGAQKSPLLPLAGTVDFVGVLPPLDHDLTGMRYVASARAVTGTAAAAPLSVVGRRTATSSASLLALDGFVSVPTLLDPATNTAWDGRNLAVSYPPGGWPADLTVYEVTSGNGLVRWVVAAPYADHAVTLPDLSGYELAGVPAGPIVIGVYGAHIEGFDYGTLKYRNLRPAGMTAYALDYFNSHL